MGDTQRRRAAIAAAAVLIAAAYHSGPQVGQPMPAPRAAATALADPPYQDCNQAHADGRYSIPVNDPAYRPDLDPDGNGLACEPSKGRRSTR
jgi:hypothetical protein